jgi:hypothetical protein
MSLRPCVETWRSFFGLNETGGDEHVPQVERYIRSTKERTRAAYNMLPFKPVPAVMVIEMVKASVFWLNAFPYQGGVSNELSPRSIVVGQSVDYSKHCKYDMGEYVEVHEEHDNRMMPRTSGALALRPTGNSQGNWLFTSLTTGRVVNRTHATKLPMPNEGIDRVHQLARRQKMNPGLVFTNRNGQIRLDDYDPDDDDDHDEDDGSYHPPPDDDDEDDDVNFWVNDEDGVPYFSNHDGPGQERHDQEAEPQVADIPPEMGDDVVETQAPEAQVGPEPENIGVEAMEDDENTGEEAVEDGENTGVEAVGNGLQKRQQKVRIHSSRRWMRSTEKDVESMTYAHGGSQDIPSPILGSSKRIWQHPRCQ